MPPEYVGAVLKLCTDKRGVQKKMLYLGNQVSLQYELPLAEVVLDFFDRLKSVSRGYASFDYEFSRFEAAPLVKLDILINGDSVDALSIIVHRDNAYQRGRELVDKMQELIPRQMFEVAVQAAIGSARHRARDRQGAAQERAGQVLRRRHLAQAQAAREAERRQEAHEAGRARWRFRRKRSSPCCRSAARMNGHGSDAACRLIVLLTWLAHPGRPRLRRRRLVPASAPPARRGAAAARDPPLTARRCYARAAGAVIARRCCGCCVAERLDFSLVLVLITVRHGRRLVARRAGLLRRQRAAAAQRPARTGQPVTEPGTVDYARSFFPVALIVLVLRSFVFEPFRIPSDSMMPTLLDGDFIIVNKYAYGLRLPVLNTQVRGDRRAAARRRGGVPLSAGPEHQLHQAPGRPAGRPGPGAATTGCSSTASPSPFEVTGAYNDGCYMNMQQAEEQLGEHIHRTMFCPDAVDRPPTAAAELQPQRTCAATSAASGSTSASSARADVRADRARRACTS